MNQTMAGCEIVQANREQVALILDWAGQEGWNPGVHDALSFYAADPTGFYLLQLDGQPIASLSAVNYGSEFAFIGLYLVKPAYRHQGYGYALWQQVLGQSPAACLGLDGVVAQQANYRKSGFVLAHSNIRYLGHQALLDGVRHSYLVRDLSAADWAELIAFDTCHFGFPRQAFLRAWTRQPDSKIRLIRDDGKIAAFGVIRACRQAYKVGPLFAPNREMALALLSDLLADCSAGSEFMLDLPEPNQAALAMVQELGMQACF